MRDLNCDVISFCVSCCSMGKINAYDKVMIENQREIWK